MLRQIKNFVRAILPKKLFKLLQPTYHACLAIFFSAYFNFPGKKLTVIGVTGTAGKSSTVMMLAHILNSSGIKTGYITTVGFSDGDLETLNNHGLSMPGGYLMQRSLKQILQSGCKVAIVECTSEGLVQNRHLGINFLGAIFTNLSPAHLDAHGSFENYRKAKLLLFKNLNVNNFAIINSDDENAKYFSDNQANKIFTSLDITNKNKVNYLVAEEIVQNNGLTFQINNKTFNLNLVGEFNVQNAILAIAAASKFNVNLEQCAQALSTYKGAAGRMEFIKNNLQATIIVDYAPEPKPMEAALTAAKQLSHNKLIHVFGATGGHRDKAKRKLFGQISAKLADEIIITNDDVYESDAQEIANEILDSVKNTKPNLPVKIILDRKTALHSAIKNLKANNLLIVTGKGSEQFLVLEGNKKIPWDDRKIIKEILDNDFTN